jgi:hypothetical protein
MGDPGPAQPPEQPDPAAAPPPTPEPTTPPVPSTTPPVPPAETAEQRRRRIAAVFGDVLPATTSDERDQREDAPGGDADDQRFLADRPPHHDRER